MKLFLLSVAALALLSTQTTVAEAPGEHGAKAPPGGPVGAPKAEAKPTAKKSPAQLRTLLDRIKYDDMMKSLLGEFYGKKTIYELDEDELAVKSSFTPEQKLALRFFVRGEALEKGQWEILFKANPELRDLLVKEGLAEETNDGKTRMKNLSVSSYFLKYTVPPRAMYLFTDLPKPFRTDGKDPESIIAITSMALLQSLEARQKKEAPIQGAMADMGSGIGIQGIALLMMNPDSPRVYGVEIEKPAMALADLNAAMNGVEARYQNVDNTTAVADVEGNKKDPLTVALGGTQLSFVAANPPFNLVPASLGKDFTRFGYGGPKGTAVTELFIKQAMPNLTRDGEVFLYGQYAAKKNGDLLLDEWLGSKGPAPRGAGVLVKYDEDPSKSLGYGIHIEDVGEYSENMSLWMKKHMPGKTIPTGPEIAKALNAEGVETLQNWVVRLKAVPGQSGYAFGLKTISLKVPPLGKLRPDALRGGVYEEMKGGVYQQLNEDRGGLTADVVKKELDAKPELIPAMARLVGLDAEKFAKEYREADAEGKKKLAKKLAEALEAKLKK